MLCTYHQLNYGPLLRVWCDEVCALATRFLSLSPPILRSLSTLHGRPPPAPRNAQHGLAVPRVLYPSTGINAPSSYVQLQRSKNFHATPACVQTCQREFQYGQHTREHMGKAACTNGREQNASINIKLQQQKQSLGFFAAPDVILGCKPLHVRCTYRAKVHAR